MALTNIEYGSLASSEVLNSNFLYLDNRITESINAINTSIASMLANIATINTSFSTLSNSVTDSVQELASNIQSDKTALKNMVNKATMLPNWSGLSQISISSGYRVPANGYVLALAESSSRGNIAVNGVAVNFKYWEVGADNACVLVTIPVKKNDVVLSPVSFRRLYFLPAMELDLQ